MNDNFILRVSELMILFDDLDAIREEHDLSLGQLSMLFLVLDRSDDGILSAQVCSLES